MEPPPKVPRRRRLTDLERIFRSALGVLRYGSGKAAPSAAASWLSLETVLRQLRRSGTARAAPTLDTVKAALELDPTRVEMFSWRDCTWVRAKPRAPRLRPPPGLSAPHRERYDHAADGRTAGCGPRTWQPRGVRAAG